MRIVLAAFIAGSLVQRGLTGGVVVLPFVIILLGHHAVGKPLRRNNGCFDRAKLKTGSKGSFDGYFIFQKRII